MAEALRICVIAVLASLVALSLLSSYVHFSVDTVAVTVGVITSIALTRKMHNVGVVAVVGLLAYLIARSLLELCLP